MSILDVCARLMRAVLPQDCLLCGAASGDSPLCAPCRGELPATPPACPCCAMPVIGGALCGTCLNRAPHFDATVAVWCYRHPVDGLIRALKYHGRLALSSFFAEALAVRIGGADLVIPMPLHRLRLAERGFNQAAEIARRIARRNRLAFALDAARRVRPTMPQAALAPRARARNVRDAFACRLDLSGMRVAVVDDVMTTGATLNELAKALKRAGAARVENWVVARTID